MTFLIYEILCKEFPAFFFLGSPHDSQKVLIFWHDDLFLEIALCLAESIGFPAWSPIWDLWRFFFFEIVFLVDWQLLKAQVMGFFQRLQDTCVPFLHLEGTLDRVGVKTSKVLVPWKIKVSWYQHVGSSLKMSDIGIWYWLYSWWIACSTNHFKTQCCMIFIGLLACRFLLR